MKTRITLLVALLGAAGFACHGGGGGGGSPTPTPLTIASTVPVADADGVPVNVPISVTFSGAIDATTVSASSLTVTNGASPVAGTVSLAAGGTTVQFVPTSPFPHLASLHVAIGAITGVNGSVSAPSTLSFRTIATRILFARPGLGGLVGSQDVVSSLLEGDAGVHSLYAPAYVIADATIATVDAPTQNQAAVHFVKEGETTLTATGPGNISGTIRIASAASIEQGTSFMFSNSLLGATANHVWDVACDGTLTSGGANEVGGASILTVDPVNNPQTFVCGATAPTFSLPYAYAGGLALEQDPNQVADGASSCKLRALGTSGMYQDIQLPALTTLTLSWMERIQLQDGNPLTTKALNVTVEDLTDATAPVQVMSSASTTAVFDNAAFAPQTVDLIALLGAGVSGHKVRLRFTALGGGYDNSLAAGSDGVHIDLVSMLADGAEQTANGGCEGLAGWKSAVVAIPRTIELPPETLGGLDITRRIYAPADGYWARVIDTYTNNSGADIATELQYDTNLGSGGNASLKMTSGAAAMESFDSAGTLPNVGGVVFTTDANNSTPGNSWDWNYAITVPNAGSVSVVQFWLLGDVNAANYSPMMDALAADVVTQSRSIGLASPYLEGMTAGEYAALSNLN